MIEFELRKIDGKVSTDKSFDYLCSLLRNGVYTVTIKQKKSARSTSQNALMWMWFTCMEDTTGQPKQDWHDYYAGKFLSRPVTLGDRQIWVPGRTSTLNTVQMTDFLNKVQADAATEWGIILPLPSDQFFSDFVDDYE